MIFAHFTSKLMYWRKVSWQLFIEQDLELILIFQQFLESQTQPTLVNRINCTLEVFLKVPNSFVRHCSQVNLNSNYF